MDFEKNLTVSSSRCHLFLACKGGFMTDRQDLDFKSYAIKVMHDAGIVNKAGALRAVTKSLYGFNILFFQEASEHPCSFFVN